MLPFITGVSISLILFAGKLLFSALSAGISGTPVSIIVLAFTGVLVVFVPPVFILTMVSPFMVKLVARSQNTGNITGSLYAMSTLVSLPGTLNPSLATKVGRM